MASPPKVPLLYNQTIFQKSLKILIFYCALESLWRSTLIDCFIVLLQFYEDYRNSMSSRRSYRSHLISHQFFVILFMLTPNVGYIAIFGIAFTDYVLNIDRDLNTVDISIWFSSTDTWPPDRKQDIRALNESFQYSARAENVNNYGD